MQCHIPDYINFIVTSLLNKEPDIQAGKYQSWNAKINVPKTLLIKFICDVITVDCTNIRKIMQAAFVSL